MCLHADTKNATLIGDDLFVAPTRGFSWDGEPYVVIGFTGFDEETGQFGPEHGENRIVNLRDASRLRDELNKVLAEASVDVGGSNSPAGALA